MVSLLDRGSDAEDDATGESAGFDDTSDGSEAIAASLQGGMKKGSTRLHRWRTVCRRRRGCLRPSSRFEREFYTFLLH